MHFSMKGENDFVETEANMEYPPNEEIDDQILYNSCCEYKIFKKYMVI